jgi:hypothetical protein
MKRINLNIDDVTIELRKKGQSRRFKVNGIPYGFVHTFLITLKSKIGIAEYSFGKHTMNRFESTTQDVIWEHLADIVSYYHITKEKYPNFKSYCKDFDADVNSYQDKEFYKEVIFFSENLHQTVSENWIDKVNVAIKLTIQ